MNIFALARRPRTVLAATMPRLVHKLRATLPRGHALPLDTWQSRHNLIVGLLWLHVLGVFAFGLGTEHTFEHSFFESLVVAVLALLAGWKRRSRTFRAAMSSLGLVTAAALLIHLSGGYIELHFLFFVTVGIITLYHDWTAYLIASSYVILHHGIVGVVLPEAVYNHPDAFVHPWKWAAIHGAFVLAVSVVGILNWKFAEAEQARSEQALREQVAAQEAVQLRDQFLSLAAHELKTPLTSLLGYAEVVQRRTARLGVLPERDQRALQVITDQAQRLQSMIEVLFDVSKMERGQFHLTPRPLELGHLLRRLVDEVRPVLDKHTVELEAPDAALIVVGDELRLEQVVQNLLQNAVKYSPSGGRIAIRVYQREGRAILEVTDQGIGIPPEALPNLFRRFFRARNVDAQQIHGLGIGLYVVHQIISLHGGQIDVQSEVGVGTTFAISLPIAVVTTISEPVMAPLAA